MELKPCPFCGGKTQHNDGGNSVYGRFWDAVWCNTCEVEMRDREVFDPSNPGMLHPAYPRGECVKRWNTRTDDAAITAAVARADALAAEVERLVNAGNQMRKRCGPRASDGNEWDAALAALRGDANG